MTAGFGEPYSPTGKTFSVTSGGTTTTYPGTTTTQSTPTTGTTTARINDDTAIPIDAKTLNAMSVQELYALAKKDPRYELALRAKLDLERQRTTVTNSPTTGAQVVVWGGGTKPTSTTEALRSISTSQYSYQFTPRESMASRLTVREPVRTVSVQSQPIWLQKIADPVGTEFRTATYGTTTTKEFSKANVLREATQEQKAALFKQNLYEIKEGDFVKGAGVFALSVGKGVYNIGKSAVMDLPRIAYTSHPAYVLTHLKETRAKSEDPLKTYYGIQTEVAESFQKNPTRFVGERTGEVFAPTIIKYGVYRPIRNVAVSYGREYVTPESVFSKQVLSGKTDLPKSPSPRVTLKKFRQGTTNEGVVTIHATENKFGAESTTYAGRHATKYGDTGDRGLFVTPQGEGSPNFLRITSEGGSYQPVVGIKDMFPTPRVAVVTVKRAGRIPQKVLRRSWEDINAYAQTRQGEVLVTGRSEVGITGSKGVMKSGTSEMEGVIPEGTVLTRTGEKQYTSYKGWNIPLDEYRAAKGTMLPKRMTAGTIRKSYGVSQSTYSKPMGIITLPRGSSTATTRNKTYQLSPLQSASSRPSYITKYSTITPKKTPSSSAVSTTTPKSVVSVPQSRITPSSSAVSTTTPKSVLSAPRSRKTPAYSPASPVSPGSRPGVPSTSPTYSTPRSGTSYTPTTRSYRATSMVYRVGRPSGTSRPPTTQKSIGPVSVSAPSKYDYGEKKSSLFNVEVRRKGKFRRINVKPLSRQSAFGLGVMSVQRTAAASFRVKEAGGRENVKERGLSLSFGESKREAGVYVQKSRYRISSSGEKSEITYRGIMASKTRSIFRRRS